MNRPKRLVLFVEGQSDLKGAWQFVNRLLKERSPWDCLFLDSEPFRLGGLANISGRQSQRWLDLLTAASKRGTLGGVLLLLDGDATRFEEHAFCAASAGRSLAARAKEAGAGSIFSVACVFAMKELEAWLIAGIESLAGKTLPGGREGVSPNHDAVPSDIEALRDAKGWLHHAMTNGYKPTTDQGPLAEMVDLSTIRSRNLRSFQRLEHALDQLVEAFRNDVHLPP